MSLRQKITSLLSRFSPPSSDVPVSEEDNKSKKKRRLLVILLLLLLLLCCCGGLFMSCFFCCLNTAAPRVELSCKEFTLKSHSLIPSLAKYEVTLTPIGENKAMYSYQCSGAECSHNLADVEDGEYEMRVIGRSTFGREVYNSSRMIKISDVPGNFKLKLGDRELQPGGKLRTAANELILTLEGEPYSLISIGGAEIYLDNEGKATYKLDEVAGSTVLRAISLNSCMTPFEITIERDDSIFVEIVTPTDRAEVAEAFVLEGNTEANAKVVFEDQETIATSEGKFQFNVSFPVFGEKALKVVATDEAGNSAEDMITVIRTCQPEPIPTGWVELRNTKLGYSIHYPPGQQIRGYDGVDSQGDLTIANGVSVGPFTVFPPSEPYFAIEVSYQYEDLPTLEEAAWATLNGNYVKSPLLEKVIQEPKQVTWSCVPALQFITQGGLVFTGFYGNQIKPGVVTNTFVSHNGQKLVMMWIGQGSIYEQIGRTFRLI